MIEPGQNPSRQPSAHSPHRRKNRFRILLGLGACLFSLSPSIAPVRAQDASAVPPPAPSRAIAPADQPAPHWAPLPTPRNGAPNILLILTDDVGYGASSTFGGPVPTPNLERLAKRGVMYTNFNTTAMCSPTRAALLTGRNHHDVGFGAITEMQGGYPGYNTELPADSRTFVEILKRGGYATAMFGKHHLTTDWMRALSGSHSQWPTDLGFDYYFGFLSADSDQWNPTLVRGTSLVDTDGRKDRLVDQDLAEDAIHWIHQEKADYPAKPFFAYYATGSAHAPQQAPKQWIEKFRGRFDMGWDALRAEIVARQKAGGILPRSASVTPRPSRLPAWDSLTATDKRLYARYMEVFAAQLAFQDDQIGRVLDELDRMGELDNTLIVFIAGDNGASGEGGPEGSVSEMRKLFQSKARYSADEEKDLDRLGGPQSYEIYPAGWAWAVNAPFPLFKQDASHLGGTRNGMVISWPKGITEPGRRIGRFQYVTDIAPTLLQLAGVAMPQTVDGVAQKPLAGVSLADSLQHRAPTVQQRTQYFEMAGNRALYQDGWWANTVPGRMPWQSLAGVPANDFEWQLYDLNTDPAQSRNVAGRFPARLEQMKAEWDRQARLHNIYPLRANADIEELRAGSRPLPQRDVYVFWGGDIHLPWTAQPDLQRGDFTIDVIFSVRGRQQAQGVLMATGGPMAGWSLKLEDGVPVLYSIATEAAADRFRVPATSGVDAGRHQLVVHFAADDEKLGSGGTITMTLDGKAIASQPIDRRAMRPMGVNEMFDIGMDTGASVVPGAQGWQRFAGTIEKMTVDAR